MVAIPNSPDEITAAWLTEALAEGGRTGGADVSVLTVTRIAEGLGVTTELYRLTPTYAPGATAGPASFVAKLASSIPEMRALSAAYGIYEREVLFYRDLAATISLKSPACYFTGFNPVTQRFIIVMEDLGGARPCDQIAGMSPDEARMAIEEVAALHARWWNRPELTDLASVIQPLGAPPYQMDERHAAAWPVLESYLSTRFSKEMMRVAERLCTALDRMGTGLSTGSRTICHGDYRADNLLFRERGDEPELVALDWQLPMQARGTFDIGYMMGSSVTSEVRRDHEMELLRLYHRRLVEGGVTDYAFDQCFQDYRAALLFGCTYLVQAGAAADRAHDRTDQLLTSYAQRIDTATKDLSLAEFVA